MRSFRRVTQRVAPAVASVASVLLFATCDFDKISGTPKVPSAADIAELFSITPAADSTVTLGGTIDLAISAVGSTDLAGTTQRWRSGSPAVASVDSLTGLVTGLTIGSAAITGRVLSPELDTGYARTHSVRVRYKAIRVAAIDSIAGKGPLVQRGVTVQGTNNANALQSPAITSQVTLTAHDSNSTSTGTNVAAISGTNVMGKANGIAYVVAVFDGFRDSVKVKVRQVAKSLAFPTTDYTATHLNMNRPQIPMIIRDVGDSIMTTSPVMRFRSSDTTVVTVDSLTGILRVKKVDTARIFVRIDTLNVGLNQVAKSQKLIVAQQVATLNKFAGDNQTDTVATSPPIMPTVTVLDSGSTPIVGAQVTFRKLTGLNATITDSVKTTDVNGRATLGSWKLGDRALTSGDSISATAGGVTTIFRATTVAGPPRKIGFISQPGSTAINSAIAAFSVQVQDSLSNIVSTATNSITMSLSNNPGGATLGGGLLTRAAVAGTATFTNLSLNAAGSGYAIEAAAAGLQSGISNGFDIFGPKTKLTFTTQPVNQTASVTMQPVRVAIQDANNITVASATDSVSIGYAANPNAVGLGGTLKVAAVNGIATFSTLTVPSAVTGYAFLATAPGLTQIQSSTFNITAVGPAAKLEFQQQPTTVVAGAVIAPSITVRVLDANGALVTSSTQTVALTVEGSPAGVTLGGNPSRAASGGIATFNDITVNRSGSYKLVATATGAATVTSATSAQFTVNTGTANKLGFVQQPTNTPFGTNIGPAVTVEVQDAAGNRVTTGTFSVTLTLGTCTSGVLTGGGAQTTTNGVATFSGLSISTTQTTCTLIAAASGLTGTTSTTFASVSSTGPAALAFTSEPPGSTAGFSTSGGTVSLKDVNGNNVTSTTAVSISISVLSGPSTTFSGTATNNATTSTTFSGLVFNTAGTYRLIATATGFDPDTSAQFVIASGSATKLGFVTQPSTIVAGAQFSPVIQVAVQDNAGNTVATSSAAINISISHASSPPFATGQTSISVNAVNGVATFSGVGIKKAVAGARIVATSSGLALASSNLFDVNAGPLVGLGFAVQPTNVTAGSTLSPSIQVSAQDSVGNAISDFTNPITVALTGGAAGAVLSGTKTITPTSGVSSFTNLSIDKSATGYQLVASASGVPNANSNVFTVNAGTATKLGWITQPAAATFFNAPLTNDAANLAKVAIQDALGNTVTTNNFTTVRISIVGGPTGTFRCNGVAGNTSCDYTVSQGVATIAANTNMTTASGGNYTLGATTPFQGGISSANANAFSVAATDVKSKLVWPTNMANGTYGVRLLTTSVTAPTVQIQDQWGNVVSATDAITVAVENDANPTTNVSGGAATSAIGGTATFGNLTMDAAGNGYTLRATAAGLTQAVTNAFNITSPGELTTTGFFMNDMVRVGDTVYFTHNNALKMVHVTGGPVTTIEASSNADRITTDGASIYWAELNSNSGDACIERMVVSNRARSTPTCGLTSLDPSNEAKIYSDGVNVYFIARHSGIAVLSVKSVPIGGGAVVDIYNSPSLGQVPHFIQSGGFLYAYNHSDGSLIRMTTTGASQTAITTTGLSFGFFSMHSGTLYFTDGSVLKSIANASATGAVTPTSLHTYSGSMFDLLVDNGRVYAKAGGVLWDGAIDDVPGSVQIHTGIDPFPSAIAFTPFDVFVNDANGRIVKMVR